MHYLRNRQTELKGTVVILSMAVCIDVLFCNKIANSKRTKLSVINILTDFILFILCMSHVCVILKISNFFLFLYLTVIIQVSIGTSLSFEINS